MEEACIVRGVHFIITSNTTENNIMTNFDCRSRFIIMNNLYTRTFLIQNISSGPMREPLRFRKKYVRFRALFPVQDNIYNLICDS